MLGSSGVMTLSSSFKVVTLLSLSLRLRGKSLSPLGASSLDFCFLDSLIQFAFSRGKVEFELGIYSPKTADPIFSIMFVTRCWGGTNGASLCRGMTWVLLVARGWGTGVFEIRRDGCAILWWICIISCGLVTWGSGGFGFGMGWTPLGSGLPCQLPLERHDFIHAFIKLSFLAGISSALTWLSLCLQSLTAEAVLVDVPSGAHCALFVHTWGESRYSCLQN